jgi:inner membrane protein
MATPLGHLLVGGTIGAAVQPGKDLRWCVLLGALAGAAADLDFLPGLLVGRPGRFHHLGSHSLLFAALAAGAAALLARSRRREWALMAGLAYSSHLLLDYFTFDSSPPRGIPVLWPASSRFFASPVPLLPDVWHTRSSIVSSHNFELALLELALFAPPLLWTVLKRRKRRHRREGAAGETA